MSQVQVGLFDFRERVLFSKSGAIAHCGEQLSRDNIHNNLYWLSSFRLNSFIIFVQCPKTIRARQRFFNKSHNPRLIKHQTVCQTHRYYSNRTDKSLNLFSCLRRVSLTETPQEDKAGVISRLTVNTTWSSFYHDIVDAK